MVYVPVLDLELLSLGASLLRLLLLPEKPFVLLDLLLIIERAPFLLLLCTLNVTHGQIRVLHGLDFPLTPCVHETVQFILLGIDVFLLIAEDSLLVSDHLDGVLSTLKLNLFQDDVSQGSVFDLLEAAGALGDLVLQGFGNLGGFEGSLDKDVFLL